MGSNHGGLNDGTEDRIERSLLRCLEWSQMGRHRKVLTEVERMLPRVSRHPKLEARLLIWKAQALLEMGCAERALTPASRSWDLEASPHACHLMSSVLDSLGDPEGSEEQLRLGWGLFPEATHLPVELAVFLSHQGRLPEALDTLDEVRIDDRIPDDLQVFLFGLRANLLAAMGRWAEAEEVLQEGVDLHPDSPVLEDTHDAICGARARQKAEHELAISWQQSLVDLDGGPGEVDDAILRCGAVNELSELVILAARRLWRAYLEGRGARPQAPDSWGAALLLAIQEIDGEQPSAAALARSTRCNPAGVRSVLARLRSFLKDLDPEFSALAFAAHSNPRLRGALAGTVLQEGPGDVIPFR